VVLASEGYPVTSAPTRLITGLEAATSVPGVTLTHAATARTEEGFVATGGRVLSVVATAASFAQARARAYEALGNINLEGGQFRSDIASRVL
jgi:phosphoribosylamine--glycine ligase